jgi:hypothetical protein
MRTWTRRMREMRDGAERELREQLGREPTEDELLARLIENHAEFSSAESRRRTWPGVPLPGRGGQRAALAVRWLGERSCAGEHGDANRGAPVTPGKLATWLSGDETSAQVARLALFLVTFALLNWALKALGLPWWAAGVSAGILAFSVERLLMLWYSRRRVNARRTRLRT